MVMRSWVAPTTTGRTVSMAAAPGRATLSTKPTRRATRGMVRMEKTSRMTLDKKHTAETGRE